MTTTNIRHAALLFATGIVLALVAVPAAAHFVLGPEDMVESGGVAIDVPGYSVPSFVRWNGDALPDLVVGEGGGGVPAGKVRVYLNTGSLETPVFSGFFYVQSNGADLVSTSGG